MVVVSVVFIFVTFSGERVVGGGVSTLSVPVAAEEVGVAGGCGESPEWAGGAAGLSVYLSCLGLPEVHHALQYSELC